MIAIDMKLPDSCVTCRFSQGDYGFCHAMPENFCGYVNELEEQGRPEWCPLFGFDINRLKKKAESLGAVDVEIDWNDKWYWLFFAFIEKEWGISNDD